MDETTVPEEALATLGWAPCEQSQSPYEPLWDFRLGTTDWYVDQSGGVDDEPREPRLKGGGPPDG